ncbi:MAG: polysaccharide deacetylase [Clostridia bacterium]|nr:polysaccharide deacetylase [Clostridia bacterium]
MNRNFTAFCAAMFASALILAFCGGFWLKGSTFALADTPSPNVKTVYLTFDDGPSDKVTPKILDVLKEENVKATFFIIGRQAQTRMSILRRAYDEGHTLAVHSFSHEYKKIYASPESLLKDIDECNEIIKSVTGSFSDVYRFPGGSYGLSNELISAVTSHGLRYVDWNASMRDAEIYNATPQQLYTAAVDTAANSERIVLLAHDSTTKTSTVKALQQLIKHYKDEGYLFSAF